VASRTLSNAYRAQIVSIYATHRRHSGKAGLAIVGGLDEHPDESSGRLPRTAVRPGPVVNSREPRARDIRFEAAHGSYAEIAEILSVRPDGLKQAASTFGAVSPAISFLYGHSDDVENSAQIDSFNGDRYEVMQIRTRANTVSQMFIRLGGSIRSELTAIESR
jgi:hypothetical protein